MAYDVILAFFLGGLLVLSAFIVLIFATPKEPKIEIPLYLLTALENAKSSIERGDYKSAMRMVDYVISEVESGSYKFIKKE